MLFIIIAISLARGPELRALGESPTERLGSAFRFSLVSCGRLSAEAAGGWLTFRFRVFFMVRVSCCANTSLPFQSDKYGHMSESRKLEPHRIHQTLALQWDYTQGRQPHSHRSSRDEQIAPSLDARQHPLPLLHFRFHTGSCSSTNTTTTLYPF